MTSAMVRLDAVVRRHSRLVVLLWLAALVAAVPFAIRQAEHLQSGRFDIPGSQAEVVGRAVDRDYPQLSRSPLAAVIVPGRSAAAADSRAGSGPPGRRGPLPSGRRGDERLPPARARGRSRRGARRWSPSSGRGTPTWTPPCASAWRPGRRRAGVTTYLVGQSALFDAMQHEIKSDVISAERLGFPIVLAVLLVAFGSLAAAALPLLLGAACVLLTGALIFFLSQAIDMSIFVINMASMIGIGVAVDYSLFVLARYRQEIRRGADPTARRATAMATSGRAVAFSG